MNYNTAKISSSMDHFYCHKKKKKKSETPWFEILLFFFFFHKSKVFESLQKIEGKKLNSRGKILGGGEGQFFTSVNRS